MSEALDTSKRNRIFNKQNLMTLGAGAVLAAIAAIAAVEVTSTMIQDGVASSDFICPEDGGSVMGYSPNECN